ncbi:MULTISPECIES: hypothetical protein [unclassified Nostoc]|uniref:hypothetical protein n=1 Tax=unclassified Nostoc TaxID=2593658 RepID=UPI0025AB349E|nr:MULTISPECIES: hypothetical protein [unclassified Nostoc]MDM9583345.1 hypothetical protein [Nostoc sp. GT001]MDZ7947736.1 hypothetical protein [Nostoc sp. EfeVER01]MDZ7993588.1 hypothetical protein [Nostoc sp. EspVER01]
MLKIKHSQLNWLLAGMTLAVIGVTIAPVSAQRAIVNDGSYGVRRSSPSVGSFIYGSPIPTPMPVDPTTGLMPQRNHYRDYSYPQFRQNIRNSTLINPTIRDSTLVNPVIINNSWRRTPFSGGRSRVIITYPR